jgi:hypothetical protein
MPESSNQKASLFVQQLYLYTQDLSKPATAQYINYSALAAVGTLTFNRLCTSEFQVKPWLFVVTQFRQGARAPIQSDNRRPLELRPR